MVKLTKHELFKIIIRSIYESEWNILYLSSPDEHPFRMQVYRDDESYRIRVYIWNLTHGGATG